VSRPVRPDLAELCEAVAASQGWRQPSRLFSREAYEAMVDAEQAKTRWSADPMLLGRLCIAERASATAMRHEMSHLSVLVWRSQVERSVDQWNVEARSR